MTELAGTDDGIETRMLVGDNPVGWPEARNVPVTEAEEEGRAQSQKHTNSRFDVIEPTERIIY